MPVQWTGFLAVVAVLPVYLGVVVGMGVWFRVRMGESLLGNAWAVVAQLQSEEARACLDRADMITDGHLVREMEQATGEAKGVGGVEESGWGELGWRGRAIERD